MAPHNKPDVNRGPVQQALLFADESRAAELEVPVSAGVTVNRIRPPVKAHGGKYYLAWRIVPILLGVRTKIIEFLEPCAFGASVFLAMPRCEREILGDINPNVVALWSMLSHQRSADELSERLADVCYDRATFEAARQEGSGSQIEQATRFLIRCRFSRGGLGTDFAWSERQRGGRPGDENAWETFREQELPKIIARARGVEVSSDPCWWTAWQSRDKIQRLIYADPPYMPKTRVAKEAYGPFEMSPMQHFWLVAAFLRAHSGPAAISGYRCNEYDRWLHDWRRIEYDTVRGAFLEGEPVYPGAGFGRETHIQLAVRNSACILGVFRPNFKI